MHCGSSIVLDFGREYCGGVRVLTYHADGKCRMRIRFGESLGEACAELREKGASNDHSLCDFETELMRYSDMQFGQTAYLNRGRKRRLSLAFVSGCLDIMLRTEICF